MITIAYIIHTKFIYLASYHNSIKISTFRISKSQIQIITQTKFNRFSFSYIATTQKLFSRTSSNDH